MVPLPQLPKSESTEAHLDGYTASDSSSSPSAVSNPNILALLTTVLAEDSDTTGGAADQQTSASAMRASELQNEQHEDFFPTDEDKWIMARLPFPSPSLPFLATHTAHLAALKTNRAQAEIEDKLEYYEAQQAEAAKAPKPAPRRLQANNPVEIAKNAVDAKTVKRLPKMGNEGLTPTTGRNFTFDRKSPIPRSPCTGNLKAYATGEKEYNPPETYSARGRMGQDRVFDNLAERRDAIKLQKLVGGRGEALSGLFDHGIQYNPTEPAMDQGYRTILIPVPQNWALQHVIEKKLKGRGQILHAQMCDTTMFAASGGTKTAKIVFVTQPEWIDDGEVLEQISVIGERPAYKVETKTWPMSEDMVKRIAQGTTRRLILCGLPGMAKMERGDLVRIFTGYKTDNPCRYVVDFEILDVEGDGGHQIAVVMNSISAAVGMVAWFEAEAMRKWEDFVKEEYFFGIDVSMTDAEVAQHIQIMQLNAHAGAKAMLDDKKDKKDGKDDENDDEERSKKDDKKGDQADRKKDSDTDAKKDNKRDSSPPRSSHSDDNNDDDDHGPGAPPGAGSILLNNDTPTRKSSALASGPHAYVPGNGFNHFLPSDTSKTPKKSFAFAPFPSVQGGCYPDGMDNIDRGDMYKRPPRQAKAQFASPGIVYKDEPSSSGYRPPTPGVADTSKMGHYKSASGHDWADEDEEEGEEGEESDDELDLGGLSLKGAWAPRPRSAVAYTSTDQSHAHYEGMFDSEQQITYDEADEEEVEGDEGADEGDTADEDKKADGDEGAGEDETANEDKEAAGFGGANNGDMADEDKEARCVT